MKQPNMKQLIGCYEEWGSQFGSLDNFMKMFAKGIQETGSIKQIKPKPIIDLSFYFQYSFDVLKGRSEDSSLDT